MRKSARFYIPPECVNEAEVVLPESVVRHAVHTLRMKPGDLLFLFDGSGIEYKARLLQKGMARIETKEPGLQLPNPRIILYQAPIKKERWEWLIEKATEIGVHTIVPMMTRFTEVDVTEKFEKKLERWKLIVQSACEQSGRSILTRLLAPVSLQEAVFSADGEKFFFYEGEAEVFKAGLHSFQALETASVFIGPEGGFAKEEVDLARSSRARVVSLGKHILRGETAGIVAASLLFWI